jgi:hypothetical protein
MLPGSWTFDLNPAHTLLAISTSGVHRMYAGSMLWLRPLAAQHKQCAQPAMLRLVWVCLASG